MKISCPKCGVVFNCVGNLPGTVAVPKHKRAGKPPCEGSGARVPVPAK